jgi:hypothetical protein
MVRERFLLLWGGSRLVTVEPVSRDCTRLWLLVFEVKCLWETDLVEFAILFENLYIYEDKDPALILEVAYALRRVTYFLSFTC